MRHIWTSLNLILLLTGVSIVVGCEDESDLWHHPNRQRYPASHAPVDEPKSLEELEQMWKKRAREDQKIVDQQAQPSTDTESSIGGGPNPDIPDAPEAEGEKPGEM